MLGRPSQSDDPTTVRCQTLGSEFVSFRQVNATLGSWRLPTQFPLRVARLAY
jgi:hypothetical protein